MTAVPQRTLTLLRRLTRTNGQAVDDTVRALAASWVQAWAELDPAWQQAIAALVDEYQRSGSWPPAWRVARIEAIATAQRRTEQSLNAVVAEAAVSVRRAVADVAAATLAVQPDVIGSQRPALDVTTPPRAITDAAVRNRQDRVTALHQPLAAGSLGAIQRIVSRPPANPAEPVGRLLHLRVQTAFDASLTRAVTIARTEPVEASRDMAALIDRVNARIVTGWCWLSLLRANTCIACWAMHGTTHPLDETGPDGHPSCACTRLPVVGDFNLPSAERAFRRLPRRDQIAILGPARFELWRAGRVGWTDLAQRRTNPGWRDSRVPTPVADLNRIAAPRTA